MWELVYVLKQDNESSNSLDERDTKHEKSSSLSQYRAEVAYWGTNFSGFQSQLSHNTVQDHLEKALTTLMRRPTKVLGASRTDSGVHAEKQVFTFQSGISFSEENWLYSLSALLPHSIKVKSIRPCAQDFHPIWHTKAKVYRYSLWLGPCLNPFIQDMVWTVPRNCRVDLIEKAALIFQGSHDFSSFCAKDTHVKTKERTIFQVFIEKRGPLINLWFLGDGFLKQMIRIIVGTLVDLGVSRYTLDDVQKILLAKDRRQAGQTAAPNGLTLVDIFYEKVPTVEEIIQASLEGYSIRL